MSRGHAGRIALAFAVAVCACTACDSIHGGSPPGPAPLNDLDAARGLWLERGPSRYEADFRWICFCTPEFVEPVTLFVENGALTGGVFRSSGSPIPAEALEAYRTVEGLFDLLAEAYAARAASVDVTFDPTFGFPREAYVDYSAQSIDEEMAFTIEEVRAQR